MSRMNPFQTIAAKLYKDGKHAHLIDTPDWPALLPHVGDTLFAFIMLELSAQEGCAYLTDARYRMLSSAQQLLAIVEGFSRLEEH